MKNTRIQPFDVLLNITGASIGRCTVVPIESEHGNVNHHVVLQSNLTVLLKVMNSISRQD